MKRRHVFPLTLAALCFPCVLLAQQPGIKVRFVISRSRLKDDGSSSAISYENAVLLKPGEQFESVVSKEFLLAVKATPQTEGVKVEIALRDLEAQQRERMTGVAVVKFGRGGAVEFGTHEGVAYSVGLLVTHQDLPPSAA